MAITARIVSLNVWSKICKIYGLVNIASGILLVAASKNATYDSDSYNGTYDDFLRSCRVTKTVGIIGAVEGAAVLYVGSVLGKKRDLLMMQNNIVSEIPVFEKEFKLEHCTLSPSVNLMSYRNNPADGIGAGLNISF